MNIEARLKDLNIVLPEAAAPVANYVPFVQSGNIVSISGQVPFENGAVAVKGIVGDTVSLEDACKAARICGLNLIAQMKAACGGNLDRVNRVVKLGGFVNGRPDFEQQPVVINAASDLMVEVFGDRGKHSRSAVGVSGLPLGAAVEIDALIEVA